MLEPQRKEKKCKHVYWRFVPGTAALRRQLADLYGNFVQQKHVVGGCCSQAVSGAVSLVDKDGFGLGGVVYITYGILTWTDILSACKSKRLT